MHSEFFKGPVCRFCGAPEIYDHGKSYRINACEKCFKIWLKERKKRIWICVSCGHKKISYSGNKNKSFNCKECRKKENIRKRIKICDVCNSVFLSRKGQEFCQRICTLISNNNYFFYPGNKKQYAKNYYKNNKTKVLITKKIYKRKLRSELADEYIIDHINQLYGIKRNDISSEDVELKRAQILLKREIKKIKEVANEFFRDQS